MGGLRKVCKLLISRLAIILANDRTGQQLREAFPFDKLPCYLLRDCDAIFGDCFREQVRNMGIHEVLCTPRSPWQRAYVERVIGSIRRECLDHVLVFHETSLRRILRSYLDYYHRSRTHLSLGKDSPEPRSIQPEPMGCPRSEVCITATNDGPPETLPLLNNIGTEI